MNERERHTERQRDIDRETGRGGRGWKEKESTSQPQMTDVRRSQVLTFEIPSGQYDVGMEM